MLYSNRSAHPGPSPASRLVVQVCATLTLIAGVWLLIFSYALAYPFTVNGVDARPRDMSLGFVLMILGAAQVRTARRAWATCLLGAVIGALLCSMPLVLGYGPTGLLNLARWNELITGAAVLVLAVTGLAAVAARSRRSR